MDQYIPFAVSLGGIITDFVTTLMGLSLGFFETHPQYHPVLALAIFWSTISLLTLALPKKRFWNTCIMGLALFSYLGAVNNTLVILGVFSGLRI